LCAVLFFLALCLFIFGHRYYRIVPPAGEFLPWKCVKIGVGSVFNWITASSQERSQKKGVLAHYKGPDASFIEETHLLGSAIMAILPIMLFWMVYDQGSTEWQAQYEMMNPSIFGWFDVPTESFGNINAVLVVLLLPVFTRFYPWLEKRGIRFTILQRMSFGFFLMVVSFVVSGLVQAAVIERVNSSGSKDRRDYLPGLLQLPQWILLSVGECMVSPEGLKFTYANVGKKLRAQSASFWLLMSALGNLIVASFETALVGSGNTALQNEDGTISYPNKYYVYSAMALAGNVWFILWSKYVFKYKDEFGSFTTVAKK